MATERLGDVTEPAWQRELRNAAQHKVDEPVLASGVFYRVGGQATALGPFSGVAAMVANGIGKRRGGGLPKRFAIAVTPTCVHAFDVTLEPGIVLGDELGVWRRAGLVVTAQEGPARTKVTVESAITGERAVWTTGNDPGSKAVVDALQDSAGALI